jgi:predicted nucleic acid-binding protein
VILVDTSVWIQHLRVGEPSLVELLNAGQVLSHPFVTGELALGNLQRREEFLRLLQALGSAAVATEPEVLQLIENERLFGLGVGFVDIHLLASARLEGVRLWTMDRRLQAVATQLGLAAQI